MIEHLRTLHEFAEFMPISAMKGTGVDTLLKEIVKRLPEGEAMYPEDHLTDQPSRFLAAEILREKILHHTQQEVPHAVAVMVDTWVETPNAAENRRDDLCGESGAKSNPDRRGRRGVEKNRHAGAL